MARLASCRNISRVVRLDRLDDGIGNAQTAEDAAILSQPLSGPHQY